MQNKFLNMLGLCRKAGKLTPGFSKTKESVLNNKCKMIFIASDISPKTEKELRFISRDREIEVIKTSFPILEFCSCIDINAGIAGIEDEGFAKALKEKLQGGNLI